jgi:hypothetical protein
MDLMTRWLEECTTYVCLITCELTVRRGRLFLTDRSLEKSQRDDETPIKPDGPRKRGPAQSSICCSVLDTDLLATDMHRDAAKGKAASCW